jgi:hypothetical protein
MPRLCDLAKTIRSKNAGVSQVTFDVIFPDDASYFRVVQGGALTAASVAALYGLAPERVSDFVTFDAARAIKFTLYRAVPSGSPGDWDVLGCQWYGPLVELEVP